jgi:hypothetical protein
MMSSMTNHCLTEDYGILRRYMGELRFNAMAVECGATDISRLQNIRSQSLRFPENIAALHGTTHQLAELAILERAMKQAFDAAECAVLTSAILQTNSTTSLDQLKLSFHPSVRRLSFCHNTISIWSSLRCDEVPPKAYKLEAPQRAIVWRQGSTIRLRLLGEDEWLAANAIECDGNFGNLCKALDALSTEEDPNTRAFGYLRSWLESEVLADGSKICPAK